MPYAYHEPIKIHYEVEGSGPPLLLHHDVAGSIQTWVEGGYVDALRDRFTLIMPDARGHGSSDRPSDAGAYVLPVLVEDSIAVLDHVGVERAHFLGYFMGGRVGLGFARYAPGRLLSLSVGGAGFEKPPRDLLDRWIGALKAGMEMYVAHQETVMGKMIQEPRRSGMLKNDAVALTAMLDAVKRMKDVGLEEAAAALELPVLLFAGTEDPMHSQVARTARKIPGATFISLPATGHFETMERAGMVLPRIAAFLDAFAAEAAA